MKAQFSKATGVLSWLTIDQCAYMHPDKAEVVPLDQGTN